MGIRPSPAKTVQADIAITTPPSSPDQPQKLRNRQQFAAKLAGIADDSPKAKVLKVLGAADDIRRSPDPVPYPEDEIWAYGTNGHNSLATLGEVCFRKGKVVWIAGAYHKPPPTSVIDENELIAGMRYLHPGPEACGYNDPLHLIRTANFLRQKGKDKALAIIGEYGRIHDVSVDETWLFLLIRILFEVPTPPGHMPALHIGAMSPTPPTDLRRIPLFPVVIVDDIPFSLLWGVALAGQPEPVSAHVEYFRKHGKLKTKTLRPPDDPYPSFQKLMASKEWACMIETQANAHNAQNDAGHTLLQVLALARTAYDPPEARQPFAYPKPSDFGRYHDEFRKTGAKWDEALQMYVKRDGSHGQVGHLANIYK